MNVYKFICVFAEHHDEKQIAIQSLSIVLLNIFLQTSTSLLFQSKYFILWKVSGDKAETVERDEVFCQSN